ncbi:MAG: PAS domain S-box protein, partial [Candidatus Omnitrophica bacterium]|nr:PAS domain S-box protein [Candidatus Omnitrophota bacterium]
MILKKVNFLQFLTVVILVLICLGLDIYSHTALKARFLYTPVFYIPIVLAAAWWGLKGGFSVSLILTCLYLGINFSSLDAVDLSRGFVFVFVGLITGIVTEQNKEAHKKLLQEKEIAQRYLDIAGVMFVVINTDERVALINKRGCDLLGYTQDEIIGKNWFDNFVPEKTRNEMRSVFRRIMAGEIGLFGYFENPILTRSREERIISWYNTVNRNEAGEIIATLSSGLDITERKRSEEILAESENKFKTIFNNAFDGIILVDVEDKRFYLGNRSFAELLGYSEEEIPRLGVEDIHFPKDMPIILERFQQLAEGKIPIANNLPVKRKDGSLFYADISAAKVTLGGRVYLLGIFRDVTVHNAAQKILMASETKYRSIINTAKDGFWHVDARGHFLDINLAACRMLGYNREELLKMKIADIEAVEKPDDIIGRINKVKDAGGECFESRHRRKDGSIIDVEISTNFIKDIEGVEGIFVFVQDITARKKAEERLRESENKFRNLVDKSLFGVYLIAGEELIFKYVNPKLAEIFGYSAEELIEKKGPVDVVFKDDWPLVRENLKKRISGNVESMHYEFRGVKKSGEPIDLEVYGSKTIFSGAPAVIGGLLDVTERKRKEEELKKAYAELKVAENHLIQAEKMRVVGSLASGIAHEVKNPLSILLQGVDYFERNIKTKNKDILLVIGQMKHAIERANNIVKGLLDFSTIFKMENSVADLNSITKNCLSLLKNEFLQYNIRIVEETQSNIPKVEVDVNKIEQVFINLLM